MNSNQTHIPSFSHLLLSNKEKLAALASYLKGHQMTLIASGANTPQDTAKTLRSLHNMLVVKMNLDEQDTSFYKSLFSFIEEIETASKIEKNNN